jgi:hypothetical protein
MEKEHSRSCASSTMESVYVAYLALLLIFLEFSVLASATSTRDCSLTEPFDRSHHDLRRLSSRSREPERRKTNRDVGRNERGACQLALVLSRARTRAVSGNMAIIRKRGGKGVSRTVKNRGNDDRFRCVTAVPGAHYCRECTNVKASP